MTQVIEKTSNFSKLNKSKFKPSKYNYFDAYAFDDISTILCYGVTHIMKNKNKKCNLCMDTIEYDKTFTKMPCCEITCHTKCFEIYDKYMSICFNCLDNTNIKEPMIGFFLNSLSFCFSSEKTIFQCIHDALQSGFIMDDFFAVPIHPDLARNNRYAFGIYKNKVNEKITENRKIFKDHTHKILINLLSFVLVNFVNDYLFTHFMD